MASTLTIGSSGSEVKELQNQLTKLGYGSYLGSYGVDGKFGSYTQSAVAAFQKAAGISETSGGGTSSPSVGASVTFLGGSVYVSSDAKKAAATRSRSSCKVIYTNYGPAWSIHKVCLQSTDGGKVYGWVDQSCIDGSGGAICGPKTWEALRKALNPDPPAAKTEVVSSIQEKLETVSLASDAGLFIINLVTGTQINIKCRPEEVTDSVAVQSETETPRGRSIGYVGYISTDNKTVSFTIPLHVDMVSDSSLESAVNKLKALEYPNYTAGAVVPPNCYVNMYRGIKFAALCTSCDVTWKGDIKNGAYTHADVSLTFKGVSQTPFSATDVEAGGNNGQ